MNLKLSRDLLAAADEKPNVTFHVTGREAAREVELLANAGFVKAAVQLHEDPPAAVIEELTDAGQKLLRVLRDQVPESYQAFPEAAEDRQGRR